MWHRWCDVLSLLCLTYPVLPVKTSLTNCSSSCCWKSGAVALLCHSSPSSPAAGAPGEGLLFVTVHKQLELAQGNVWIGSDFVSRHLTCDGSWSVRGFPVWLPAPVLSIERNCGRGLLKDVFLVSESLRLRVTRVAGIRWNDPDEQVSGGCLWVGAFFQQALSGCLVPPPAVSTVRFPHLP